MLNACSVATEVGLMLDSIPSARNGRSDSCNYVGWECSCISAKAHSRCYEQWDDEIVSKCTMPAVKTMGPLDKMSVPFQWLGF